MAGISAGYGMGGQFTRFDPVVSEHNQSGELFRIEGQPSRLGHVEPLRGHAGIPLHLLPRYDPEIRLSGMPEAVKAAGDLDSAACSLPNAPYNGNPTLCSALNTRSQ
jgi:hypothetical protein